MRQFLKFALIGAVGLISVSIAASPAMASLVLVAGPDQGSIPTNNFGFSGDAANPNANYWSGSGTETYGPHNTGNAAVAILFVFGANGAISTYFDSSAGTYDDVEDTQIGVLNNSGGSLSSIQLTGTGIFGFDGDGISSSCGSCNIATTAIGASAPSNAHDTSSGLYGGPMSYFTTGAPGSNGNFSSTASPTAFVNFVGGLGNGSSTYFSLEGNPTDLANIGVSNVATPEPSSLLLLGFGLGLGGIQIRRRNRK